jgi:hypothetical protein
MSEQMRRRPAIELERLDRIHAPAIENLPRDMVDLHSLRH